MRVPITLSLHLPNYNLPGARPDEVFERISAKTTTTLDLIASGRAWHGIDDGCNLFGDAARVRHLLRVLQAHCEDVGRDFAEITKTVALAGAALSQVFPPAAVAA